MNQFEQPQIDIGKIKPFILIGVGLLLILIFWSRITITIQPGHAGLLYKTFGNGISPTEIPMRQGFHLIAPWNKVIIYEIRQNEKSETLTVLSSNLLDIKLDVTVFYQPVLSKLGKLEIERGNNYVSEVIIPVMRSVSREVLAQYLPEEINTTKREAIEQEIIDVTRTKLANNYIQLNDILIRNITLPDKLRASIEKKLQKNKNL